MGQSHERQNCACFRHVEESLKHGRPQHVVVSTDAVDTQNRRSGVGISCNPQEMTHTISARSSGQGILKRGTLTLEFWHELPSQNFRNQPSQRSSCGNAPDPAVWFHQSCESRSHEGFGDVRRNFGLRKTSECFEQEFHCVHVVQQHLQMFISASTWFW